MVKLKGYYYFWRYHIRKCCPKIWNVFHLKYVKREFVDDWSQTGEEIKKLIQSEKPFMAARIGANESFSMRTFEFSDKKRMGKAMKQLCECAGFFPERQSLGYDFAQKMTDALKNVDICGVLDNPAEDYFINKYTQPECKATVLYYLECFREEHPWSALLKGKRVLVVHPFDKTIQKQYKKREHLFPGRDVLPEFELITYKAIQTIAGEKDERFETWFEALDFMTEEISHIDFDIALLGCGAYGFPLAANIKRMGKQAIQIGGGLQLYFGIKGKRWDEMPEFARMYNDSWVYPDESEVPKAANKVEGACYW